MNKDEVVESMISYIEDAEKDLQASRMLGDSKSGKIDIVNSILDKLEKEMKDEN